MSFEALKINVKKEAFRNMMTHVLRYGNEQIESVEVMGVCIGKINLDEKEIDLINAIPIKHGINVSSGFSQKDINLFSKIEEKYSSQSQNQIVGWYLSHPGWGLYFNDIALKNHKYFQNEKKPYGFMIVFDYTLMGKEGNFGFEIYSLNNYEEGFDYHTVEYNLELPNTLEYFRWVQKFVEDIFKESPVLIKEFIEISESTLGELQEIPKPEDSELKMKDKKLSEITSVISGFKEGGQNFANSFFDTFKTQLGDWTNNIKDGTLKGSNLMKDTVEKMKNKISDGMSKIESWFEKNLDSILLDFKKNISNIVDIRVNNQKDLSTKISNSETNLISEVKNIIENKIDIYSNKISDKIQLISDKVSNLSKVNSHLNEIIENSSSQMNNIDGDIKILTNSLDDHLASLNNAIDSEVQDNFDKLMSEFNRLKDEYNTINNNFQKLHKLIEDNKN